MEINFYGPLFRFLRFVVRIVYPKYHVHVPENSKGPVVYISHHQNLFGPFVIMLWFPRSLHAWILHVFLNQAACFKQYTDYTFTKRFGWNRYLAKVFVYPISFFIAALVNSMKGIPVYRGSKKILATFQQSIDALSKGESIVIFPDIHYSDVSASTREIYDGFLYLEKYYYKKTGRHVCFVPLVASKGQHLLVANEQICFRDGADFKTEREIVAQKILNSLNDLAEKCNDTINGDMHNSPLV